MIHLLYAYHAGANCRYFEEMLKYLQKNNTKFRYTKISSWDFLNSKDLDSYDVLVYHSFPDESHSKKFNEELVYARDKVFFNFKGQKILLDSFDQGSSDAFTRFANRPDFDNINIPRIKHTPSPTYEKLFNVICPIPTTGWEYFEGRQKKNNYSKAKQKEKKRPIDITCSFTTGIYPHLVRENVLILLQEHFLKETSFKRILPSDYYEFLRTCKIFIGAHGFGEISGAYYQALKAGALLFAHEKLKNVSLLPWADLKDGKDFVSFNLDNFIEKLKWILKEDKIRKAIQISGQNKFFQGFDIPRSAKAFYKYLNEEHHG